MPNPHFSIFSRQPARHILPWLLLAGLTVWPMACTHAVTEIRRSPIVRAVHDAGPAVVNIQGQKSLKGAGSKGGTRQVNGMGTGVVVDPRGYILTNHHVVDGVRQINVTLKTGQTYVAKIISRDRETDLAIIRIRAPRSLPIIKFGTSQDLMTGETVIAVGNAFGYENTVTTGIISALHRNVQVNESQRYLDLIQTDASINPGNSGGPLLNIDGEMIGVNVAVRAGAQGIGFAIPIDKALDIAAQMLSIEQVDNHWHGMTTVSIEGRNGPVSVVRVDRNSPADKGGLERGDQLQRIGTLAIQRPMDIERALLGRRTGDPVSLVVQRNNESVELVMTLADRTAKTGRMAQASRTKPPTTPKPSDALQQATWDSLGLILKPEPRSKFRQRGLAYSGGMRVISVRTGSSAAIEGIREGDVLVKMHRWTTTSEQDIRNILRRTDSIARLGTVKFYIVRGNDTFFGQMMIASRVTGSRR